MEPGLRVQGFGQGLSLRVVIGVQGPSMPESMVKTMRREKPRGNWGAWIGSRWEIDLNPEILNPDGKLQVVGALNAWSPTEACQRASPIQGNSEGSGPKPYGTTLMATLSKHPDT